ncbi:MAG: hypothetical protein ACTS78_03645 [Arsenophonus sp. NC-WZS1-MAG3]
MWITAGIFVMASEASFIVVIKVPYTINKNDPSDYEGLQNEYRYYTIECVKYGFSTMTSLRKSF